jgi:hypothetical protein
MWIGPGCPHNCISCNDEDKKIYIKSVEAYDWTQKIGYTLDDLMAQPKPVMVGSTGKIKIKKIASKEDAISFSISHIPKAWDWGRLKDNGWV